MDETEDYKSKLKSLKKYIPFLVNMMADLRMKGNRDAQLNKIQSLHDMITDDKKKLKLETLNRCEEVLTNIYIKVNPQFKNKPVLAPSSPGDPIEIPDSPQRLVDETPRSPSPERGCFLLEPRNIPTEKIDDRHKGSKRSSSSNIPKIDIYGAAAFDILLDKKRSKSPSQVPDISKPPISLDDLKNLEDDVQVNQLTHRPIDELEKYRNELELQLRVENVTSALDSNKEINTTVRNKLDLSHVKKVKEAKSGASKNQWYDHFDIDLKGNESKKVQSKIVKVPTTSFDASDVSSLDEKDDSIPEISKKESKDVKKSKDHKKERDSSKEKSKKDRERDRSKDKKSDHKDKTKHDKEKSSSSKYDKSKSRDDSRDNKKTSPSHRSDPRKKEDKKSLILNRSASLTNDLKSRLLNSGSLKTDESTSSLKLDECSLSSLDSSVSSKDDKKDETKNPQSISKKEPRMSFEEQLIAPEQKALKKPSFEDQLAAPEQKTFKRLADKYNPKPRRTSLDNIDKVVSKKIEKNMKSAPSKVPDIFETLSKSTSSITYEKIPEPTPPPASLLGMIGDKDNSPKESEKTKPVQLPEILQRIFEKANKTTAEPPKNKPEPKRDPRQDPRRRPPLFLSRDPASQRDPLSQIEMVPPPFIRDPCPESGPPSPTPMRTLPPVLSPPIGQQGSMLSPTHTFMPPVGTGRFQSPNLGYPASAQGIDFIPPSPCLDFGGATPRPEFEIPPSPNIELHPLRPDFLENSMRVPFQNVNFLQKERFLNENATQPMYGGTGNPHPDMIPPPFGTQNSPIPPLFGTQPNPIDQYDLTRLSQYELHKQQVNFYQVNNYAGNFGGMPMLQPEIPSLMHEPKPYISESGAFHQSGGWREDAHRPPQRPSWRDDRRPGDPRNYREYREMRDREERERREREREARLLREKEESKKAERARSSSREDNRERARSKSRHREDRSSEPVVETDKSNKPTEKSRFDKMYSKTNRDRSGSRSKSGSEDEQFVSPLDALYSGENDKRTGRGYGVQSFRIPKKKREDPRTSRSTERDGDRERNDKDREDTSKDIEEKRDTSKEKEAKGAKDKQTESKSAKKVVRRIESDDEENYLYEDLDNTSDRGAPSDRDDLSDQEIVEKEPDVEKVVSKASKTNKIIDKSKKKVEKVSIESEEEVEELQPEDDIILIKDEAVGEQGNKLKKGKKPVTKSKAKSVKAKVEPIIKIEESEPDDIIEIKDEEQEDRKKTLRKRSPKKIQSPVASPTKKQPARKAKKTPTIPLPVIVKEERDSDLEEIPSELETIDVDDDEETYQEIKSLEESQLAEQAAQNSVDVIKERFEPEGATNEELDMFVSEYVLEVTGDTSKVFVPMSVEVKKEIIYDVEKVIAENNLETSKQIESQKQIVETIPKTSSTKKTSSLEDEAQKRTDLIGKLAKPNETFLETTSQESEADAAAKELEDLLQSSQESITAKVVSETSKVLEAVKTAAETPVTVTKPSTTVTELPPMVGEPPVTVTEPLTAVNKPPTTVTEHPVTVTKPPITVIELTPTVSESPIMVTEPLTAVKEPPITVTEHPVKVTESSASVTETPTAVETTVKSTELQKNASEIVAGIEKADAAKPVKENLTDKLTDTLKKIDEKSLATDNLPELAPKETEVEQPSVKATEVEIQEPTSSQDEINASKKVESEKIDTSQESEQNDQVSANETSVEVIKEDSKIVEAPAEAPAEAESSKKSDDTPEPTEPNILAHFFENLLKSKNKQDKKTALFSLIQTFSDSFTDKELNKITKIIKADQDDDESDEEATKKDETEKTEVVKENIPTVEPQIKPVEEETPVVGSTTEEEISPLETNRAKRLSSTTEEENQSCDTSETKTIEKDENIQEELKSAEPEIEGSSFEEPVLVSVGERIKSRKRNIVAPKSSLAGKKKKTELDKIHEDIKEMFIRDGVLTATGKRMSRMLKEDPNALSPTKSGDNTVSEASKAARKKPGPKSKTRESKSLKDVRIVLSKIPDNKFKIVTESRRSLRSNTSIPDEDKSVASDSSEESDLTPGSSEQSAAESEQEEESQEDNKKPKEQKSESIQPKKVTKKRLRTSWAMGIIKKSKKKLTHVKSRETSPEHNTTLVNANSDNNASLEEDLDKLFVEPDTSYYYDPEFKRKLVCKLCNFTGMFITTHYLKEHPHSEVLCSRFSPEQAEGARKDYQCNKKKYDAIVNKRLALKYNYSCRFCGFSSQTQPIFFYEHCTTHTGEYRHQCGICQFYSVTSKTLNQHFITVHPNEEKDAVRETYTKAIIYGYICGDCNYVQLKEKAVIEHCSIYHRSGKPNVFKINMSQIMDPALEDHKTDLLLRPEEPVKAVSTSESKKEDKSGEKPKKVKNISKKTPDDTIKDSDEQPKKKVKKATGKIPAVPDINVTESDVSEKTEESDRPIKKIKKVSQKKPEMPVESVTDTDVSENKQESERPIKKIKKLKPNTIDESVTDTDVSEKKEESEKSIKKFKKVMHKKTDTIDESVTDTDVSEKKEESEKPIKKFKKVMQKKPDTPDESVTDTDVSEKKEESEKAIRKIKKMMEKKLDIPDESVTDTDVSDKKEESEKPMKKVKKVAQKKPETPDETVTDSDVSTNKQEVEPPKIRRKPGPKSKTRPQEVPSEVETETEERKIKSPPPVRRKPGPKSRTQKKMVPEVVQTSDSENPAEPETTDSETTSKDHNDSSASEDLGAGESGLKAAKILRKRRSLEALICKENGEDLETVIALSSRSSRAAKQKASKHIKFFLESNECSPRKLKALEKERRKSIESKAKESNNEEMHALTPADKEDEDKPKDTNIFTSGADTIQEEKSIEEERLKKMEELNKSLNTRSSKLDFVEKLSNRLTNEETPAVKIKEEPKDVENERSVTPVMPVLEKQVSTTPVRMDVSLSESTASPQAAQPSRKPTLEDSTPMTSVNINLRSNSLFPDIIQKLQGKVGPPQAQLTPSSEPSMCLEIGKLIRATKQGGCIVFSCHSENCYVSTKDKMVFQLHCKFGHRDLVANKECLCDHCGVNITTTQDTTLMENLYDHLMFAHSDFLELSPKSAVLRMRRMSGDKLSIKREETEEPVIKKEKEDEESSKQQTDGDMSMDTTEPQEPVASQGTLEMSSDNPFTFKIAEVMSLAESPTSSQSKSITQSPKKITQVLTLSPRSASGSGQPTLGGIPSGILVTSQAGIGAIPGQPSNAVKLVSSNQPHSTSAGQSMVVSSPSSSAIPPPPLTPISSKPQPQSLVIKEAKLTQAELNKPRKAPKAMTKFIETPGDLYKCPHYYCLFTTNFRAFLERHLKAHKSDTEVMIPCVYCDLKTPWEHVPMHLDIRHAHCRFACKYCLYRSWLKEYVCLHQDNHHPSMSYAVIQLPQHKAAKKFSVVDVKIDPKTLCEPFRCLCDGTTQKEYLYENEFDQHLKHHQKCHPQSILRCGYKGCHVKNFPSNQLVGHWASFHGICTYQCGYCKMSSKELVKMYTHFSQFHQCVNPDILVRIGDYVLDINKELGYSPEAFDRLQHITNLPSNFLTPNKSKGVVKLIQLSPNAQSSPNTQPPEPVPSLTGVNVIPTPRRISVIDNVVTSTGGAESINPSLSYVLPSMDVNTPPLSYVLAATSNVVTSSETITLHGVSGGQSVTNVVSVTTKAPKSAPGKTSGTLASSKAEKTDSAVLKTSTGVEVLNLRNLMAPNVTVVSTKHSILSQGGSPIVTKPLAPLPNLVSSEKAQPVLPASISWTKLPTDSGTGNNDEQRTLNKKEQEECVLLESEAPKDLTDGHRTPSPILLPDTDENSLDEPLFDNIDVNTDSPVVDPLSIEPTIPALPPEEEQDPIGISSEDPLRVPTPVEDTAGSSEVATTSEGAKGPTLRRSTSVLSNSDDEGDQKTTGLRGFSLFQCAVCTIAFQKVQEFKNHVMASFLCRKEGKRPYQCVHCDKQLKTVIKLVQHIKVHGVLRYSCSLCSVKFAVAFLAKMHMKTRHQISNITMLPVESGKTNQENDHFIMRPVLALQPPPYQKEKIPGSGDNAGDSPNKSAVDEFTFMPDKINDVPMRQIFTKYAKCGLCNFQTKVRVNILRHLQMHLDDKWVPDTAPVNPVPCLEKNEKMFDKMINLASSSMEGRMGGSGKSDKEKDEDKLPEYVPSHCRFICCAQGCTYLCLEEPNLRHHIMALHSDESDFSCGHCKNKIEPSDVDNVIKHLKLHGLQLYKCKYCNFVHNSKHKVERHAADHVDVPVKIVTVRHMDFEQDSERFVEPAKEATIPKSRPWKCCLCKYTTTTEELVKNHIQSKHYLDSQFKCGLCSFQSQEKGSFPDHFKQKHANHEVDITYVYQFVEDEVPKEDEPEVGDTTPLWQRDKPRVRHIRGILFDEAAPPPITKSPKAKFTKQPASGTKTSTIKTASPVTKNLFNALTSVSKSSTSRNLSITKTLYDSSPDASKSSASKYDTSPAAAQILPRQYEHNNLSEAIDAVARGIGEVEPGLQRALKVQSTMVKKVYGQAKPKSDTEPSDSLKLNEKKHKKTVVESDPLKTSQTIEPIIVPNVEDFPPVLGDLDGDNDVKYIFPTLEEINKIKQGSDEPIIIIDDDEDDNVQTSSREDVPTLSRKEPRGKKRGGDLLQEALKMAKLDDISGTEQDDDGVPISEYSEENLKKIFGHFGMPNNRQWKCPLCLQFRSKRISDFIFHIFKDLNIFRYRCKACQDDSITFKYMLGHIKTHFEVLTEDDIDILPSNHKLETWIQMVLREQSLIITSNIPNLSKPVALVDENITCMFCSERFPNAAEAAEHMLKHWITKPFLCMYCPKDYYTRWELRHHQATTHPKLKQVLVNVSPTVAEAMQRFDDGFRKRRMAETNQDFPVDEGMKKRRLVPTSQEMPATKKMRLSEDLSVSRESVSNDTINIVSVNDILSKGLEEKTSQKDADLSVPSTSAVDEPSNTINIGDSDDDELIVVTKTSEFIPNEDEVYACLMCAYVTDREQTVMQHLCREHGPKSVNRFKKLSRKAAETSHQVMACNVCNEVYTELNLRLHFMEQHSSQRCAYVPYIFTCNTCFARMPRTACISLKLSQSRKAAATSHQVMACNVCNKVYTELNLRLHFMEQHSSQRCAYVPYIFTCNTCFVRFTGLQYVRRHCATKHPNVPADFSTIIGYQKPTKGPKKKL